MAPHSFEPLKNAAYPCFLLDNDGEFWYNDAVKEADPPLNDPDKVKRLLKVARREMDEGGPPATTLPLLTDALSLRTLSLMKLEDGLFAVAVDEKEAPVTLFSSQMRELLTNVFSSLHAIALHADEADKALVDSVDSIQQNSYALLRLASNIESGLRIEKAKYRMAPVDLTSMVDAVCTTANFLKNSRGVPVRTELPELPVVVRADRGLLDKAILNLLNNSMRYTRDGNEITVRLRVLRRRATLTVEDRGMGIKPEYIEHIFEPYFSVHPYGDTEERPGLGLGLAVVRQAVCGFGGTVNAESSFGEGTSIHLTFQLDESAEPVLESKPAGYSQTEFSSFYVQMNQFCNLPILFREIR